MRAGGINWIAILAAAVAFYAIGFVIYGLLVPAESWMAMSGISEAEIAALEQSRMPFSVVMPLMTAMFMALLFKWGSVKGSVTGAQWGVVIALASAVPANALWLGLWRRADRHDDDRQRPFAARPCRGGGDPRRLALDTQRRFSR